MIKNKSSRFSKKLIAVTVLSMCGIGSVMAQEESASDDSVLEEVVVQLVEVISGRHKLPLSYIFEYPSD